MGKSIRSKQKRKHRTEFRNTIGTVAYEKNMEHVQSKLKECIEKQSTSMQGLERLSKQLGNNERPEPQNFDDVTKSNESMAIEEGDSNNKSLGVADALETTTARVVTDLKGENKAPKKKSRKGRKYSYMLQAKGEQKKLQEKPKKQPKFFCQF